MTDTEHGRRSGWLWIWIALFVIAVLVLVLWTWPAQRPAGSGPATSSVPSANLAPIAPETTLPPATGVARR